LSKLKAVTFDLWQTLLLDNRELGRARTLVRLEGAQSVLARLGMEFDLETIRLGYRACYRECQRVREERRDLSFRQQVEFFIDQIEDGLLSRLDPEAVDEIESIYSDSFFVHPPLPHRDAVAVLRDVKAMGLSVGLISNTGMTPGVAFRRFLEEKGMLGYFDTLTFSDEVLLSKPSDEIFLMTLRAMGATPEQSIHVGDHVKNDVVGANRCGLKTVWITGFYENEDPANPETQPDETVDQLAHVVPAIANLTGRARSD
jgi:HAD superfamily hydrolase (TIGR01509 family)